jgi:hypothetical protein
MVPSETEHVATLFIPNTNKYFDVFLKSDSERRAAADVLASFSSYERNFCSLPRFIERICRCVRNSAHCALATTPIRRISPVRPGTLDKSYRLQSSSTADRLKQQPRHCGHIGSNLFGDSPSFYPTTIIELPRRTCKVSSNDRSLLIDQLGLRGAQCPMSIDAAVNLISTSNSP